MKLLATTSRVEAPFITVIIAGYDNSGRMVFCDTSSKIINIPKDSTVTSIKVMMWENLANLVPLTSALLKSVQ